ncbi:hypothetical protein L3Q82_000016 [Scortum barcoo]|uniref:Uncharacterized protein n=1 Tax=Scortum barcoo TaxID=214431 RepID=A0ACB8XAI0_9TELE|nr:hypothetical protein L3Q82_000016 [Scortum barcoo]
MIKVKGAERSGVLHGRCFSRQERMKTAADCHRRPAPAYTLGQKVWLSTKDLPLHVHSKKLTPRFVGPFPVSKIINPVSVQLRLPRSLRVHPTFHVSKLKPVRESPLDPPTKPLPPPKLVNGGPVYKVKKLLAVCKRGRGRQFLVDWEGYGPEEHSWIPASFIVDNTLIDDFYQSHPEEPWGNDRKGLNKPAVASHATKASSGSQRGLEASDLQSRSFKAVSFGSRVDGTAPPPQKAQIVPEALRTPQSVICVWKMKKMKIKMKMKKMKMMFIPPEDFYFF